MPTIKCVVVGDASVGKTALLHHLQSGDFKAEYHPTVLDECTVNAALDGTVFEVDVTDTAGQSDYATLRTSAYRNQVDVALLCFSVVSRRSFDGVEARWLPELTSQCGGATVVLVSTCTDRRRNAPDPRAVVTWKEASEKVKKLGLRAYCETSAWSGRGIQQLRETIVRAGTHAAPPPVPDWLAAQSAVSSKLKRFVHSIGGGGAGAVPAACGGLSRECWWRVCTFLAPRDIARCAATCKAMKLIAGADQLWLPRCLDLDPTFTGPTKGATCKEFVRDNGCCLWFNPKLFPDQIKRIEREKQQAAAAAAAASSSGTAAPSTGSH